MRLNRCNLSLGLLSHAARNSIANLPHFTLQIFPSGPLLDAFISVSDARRTALIAANQAIPSSVQIRALVDTGASSTCLDPSVVTSLGLTATGTVPMVTPSTGTTPHIAETFDIGLVIPHPTDAPLVIPTMEVSCVQLLASQGFHALIGRDILERCVLNYNGTRAWYTLAY
jgi:predicted aspartyl protease